MAEKQQYIHIEDTPVSELVFDISDMDEATIAQIQNSLENGNFSEFFSFHLENFITVPIEEAAATPMANFPDVEEEVLAETQNAPELENNPQLVEYEVEHLDGNTDVLDPIPDLSNELGFDENEATLATIDKILEDDKFPLCVEFQIENHDDTEKRIVPVRRSSENELKRLDEFSDEFHRKLEALAKKTQASIDAAMDNNKKLMEDLKVLDVEVEVLEKKLINLSEDIQKEKKKLGNMRKCFHALEKE